jgi:hypothetical protein
VLHVRALHVGMWAVCWFFDAGGIEKYDNLVRLACFIRRYFSKFTFRCYLSLPTTHVARVIHTCSGLWELSTTLSTENLSLIVD